MPRIPAIRHKTDVAAEHQAIFDSIVQSRGEVRGPFSVLLHSPDVAGRIAHVGSYVRFESTLDPKLEELAVITATREMDCQYAWTAHVAAARRVGVREQAILAIHSRRAPDGLAPDEAQVVTYVHQLLRAPHRVEQATFDALRARLGVQALVDLTATVGYYGLLACALNAFEVAPDSIENALPI